jgi:hypothetical protein
VTLEEGFAKTAAGVFVGPALELAAIVGLELKALETESFKVGTIVLRTGDDFSVQGDFSVIMHYSGLSFIVHGTFRAGRRGAIGARMDPADISKVRDLGQRLFVKWMTELRFQVERTHFDNRFGGTIPGPIDIVLNWSKDHSLAAWLSLEEKPLSWLTQS